MAETRDPTHLYGVVGTPDSRGNRSYSRMRSTPGRITLPPVAARVFNNPILVRHKLEWQVMAFLHSQRDGDSQDPQFLSFSYLMVRLTVPELVTW